MTNFCSNCGIAMEQNSNFCIGCGAAVSTTSPATPSLASRRPARNSHRIFKTVLVLLAIFTFFVLLATGGCVYIAYRAKKKTDEIKRAFESRDADKTAGALGVGDGNKGSGQAGTSSGAPDLGNLLGAVAGAMGAKSAPPSSYQAWNPTESAPEIPLREGLVLVASHHFVDGDHETIERIDSTKPQSVGIAVSEDKRTPSGRDAPQSRSAHRTVLRKDLQNSHQWVQSIHTGDPDVFPGTTAISISSEVLNELNQEGQASFKRRASTLETLISISSSSDSSQDSARATRTARQMTRILQGAL